MALKVRVSQKEKTNKGVALFDFAGLKRVAPGASSMRKIRYGVDGEFTPRHKNPPSRQQRRQNRQVLNAILFQKHLETLLRDLKEPEGIRSCSALLELARLAPSAAKILTMIEDHLETAPAALRPELERAHHDAWQSLEFDIEAEDRRAA